MVTIAITEGTFSNSLIRVSFTLMLSTEHS